MGSCFVKLMTHIFTITTLIRDLQWKGMRYLGELLLQLLTLIMVQQLYLLDMDCSPYLVLLLLISGYKRASKIFPKHETRHVSEHEISKIKQMMLPDTIDGPVRPIKWIFHDHLQPVNDLDFHHQSTILISGAKDHIVKFFDFSKTSTKRAYLVIHDNHNVRSTRYLSTGGTYVTVSKDGVMRIWDGVTAQCVHSRVGAHGSAEACWNLAKMNRTLDVSK
ncbi:hypothetical protein MKX03_020083, partial [Papaver bracteatum]